jgi:1-deoxy-D-xylulose-5-phosphate reductoisomerase
MGRKITIDSATLMNKGLEVIEAHWLFNTDYHNIDVIVHPQSVIHSMVEMKDGAVIAQMGVPDMRNPILYALGYPKRMEAITKRLNFSLCSSLTFEEPDMETFRCLKLAYLSGKEGGTMHAVLNASNEVAVDLFLKGRIAFLDIPDIVEECLTKHRNKTSPCLEDILEADRLTRAMIYNNLKVV